MFGLVFSSLGNVVQGGFVLGTGLLLDTFLVRTVTVPAIAVLAGKANWWRPSGLWPLRRDRGNAQPMKRKPLLPDLPDEEAKTPAWADDDLIGFSLYDGLRL
jgi:RND superfamily putative drug exporter